MGHVVEAMLLKIDSDKIDVLYPVKNFLDDDADVEHLITLYESSGTRKGSEIARELKRVFREEILAMIAKLGAGFSPVLFSALIDMYNVVNFNEKIAAFLTLNYEDILERAMDGVLGGFNYSFGDYILDKGH